jgi:hypothetical protein
MAFEKKLLAKESKINEWSARPKATLTGGKVSRCTQSRV